MKIKFKVNKRHQLVVLIGACAAAIAMMVVRFDYALAELKTHALVTIGLLILVVLAALPVALLLRWFNRRNEDIGFPSQRDFDHKKNE